MKLSAAVMHAPWSGRRLGPLIDELPEIRVVLARAGAGVADTARRAWRAREPDATHHLVIQDDAVLCCGFSRLAREAIAARPFVPISFFTDRQSNEPGPWFTNPDHLSALATVLPVQFIAPWLAHWGTTPETEHDDGALLRWLNLQGLRLNLTWPSLVEHGTGPSLLGHAHRRAGTFHADPGTIDWSSR